MSHDFTAKIVWTGDCGEGTRRYRGYDRTWSVTTPGKRPIECSNDPVLGGDPAKHNPEDLFLASLAACHMLWYLHLASEAGIAIRGYEDAPLGIGEFGPGGEGRFIKAILRPQIEVERGTDWRKADSLHQEIHKVCFIARSVSFPIEYQASCSEV